MPWVKQDMCAGCGICVDYCPTGAIRQEKPAKFYLIDDDKCIRCGKCHTVCPKDAVRHDSEKIPELVEQNMAKTSLLLKNYDKPDEQREFIDRMVKHHLMRRKVADITVKQLGVLKTNLRSGSNATNKDAL